MASFSGGRLIVIAAAQSAATNASPVGPEPSELLVNAGGGLRWQMLPAGYGRLLTCRLGAVQRAGQWQGTAYCRALSLLSWPAR